MKAIYVTRYGGPEVIEVVDVPEPVLEKRQIRVKMKVTGYNFHDAATRKGIFPDPPIPVPFILGVEGVGIVEAVGDEVTEIKIGDRVSFNVEDSESYAEKVVIDAERAIPLLDDISFEVAAAMTAQGMTAQYLINEFRPVTEGTIVLIQAAASGMGILLTQWAKHLGAKVYGTVSNATKAEFVKKFAADEVIIYTQRDLVQAVKQLTDNRGVDFVIDGVGTTIGQSLEAVKTRGLVVTYGLTGGVPELMNPFNLLYRSRTLAGADLFDFIDSHEDLLKRADAAFDGYRQGWLKPNIAHVLPLQEAQKAHYLMQDRNLIGKILLTHDA